MTKYRYNPIFYGRIANIEYFLQKENHNNPNQRDVYMAKLPNCDPIKLTELRQIVKELTVRGTPQCPQDICNWLVQNGYGTYMTAHHVKTGERNARNADMLMLDIKDLYQYLIEHPTQQEYVAVIDNARDIEIFIGIFAGDEESVIKQAAEIAKTNTGDIILYPI